MMKFKPNNLKFIINYQNIYEVQTKKPCDMLNEYNIVFRFIKIVLSLSYSNS
jgi:hypothetical protein